MKIIKIGKFNGKGEAIGFVFETEAGGTGEEFIVSNKDGVRIGGVEIVEWTEARKAAMNVEGAAPAIKKPRKPREKNALGKGIDTSLTDKQASETKPSAKVKPDEITEEFL